jgi:hypothetical protein
MTMKWVYEQHFGVSLGKRGEQLEGADDIYGEGICGTPAGSPQEKRPSDLRRAEMTRPSAGKVESMSQFTVRAMTFHPGRVPREMVRSDGLDGPPGSYAALDANA